MSGGGIGRRSLRTTRECHADRKGEGPFGFPGCAAGGVAPAMRSTTECPSVAARPCAISGALRKAAGVLHEGGCPHRNQRQRCRRDCGGGGMQSWVGVSRSRSRNRSLGLGIVLALGTLCLLAASATAVAADKKDD